jgi:hypothetical protein
MIAIVNIQPTQIKTENTIIKKLKYYNTQRWVFFTLDVTKDNLFLYDINFNKIDVSLSAKKNAFGFKRHSNAVQRYLLELAKTTSIYRWQDLNYTLTTKPIIASTDTINTKYTPHILEKGIYILEKKPIMPYEWKKAKKSIIQSKYLLIKVD